MSQTHRRMLFQDALGTSISEKKIYRANNLQGVLYFKEIVCMKKSSNLNLYQPLLCSRNLVSNKILVDYYFDNPCQLLITHDMSLIYIYIGSGCSRVV